MDLFVILRRNGFADAEALSDATTRSVRVSNEEMPDEIRWVRAYVLDEGDGALGTVCVYRATDAEAIREHARRAELPIDEILAVSDTILVRPDPVAPRVRPRGVTPASHPRVRRGRARIAAPGR
jgi:hypothetical protein